MNISVLSGALARIRTNFIPPDCPCRFREDSSRSSSLPLLSSYPWQIGIKLGGGSLIPEANQSPKSYLCGAGFLVELGKPGRWVCVCVRAREKRNDWFELAKSPQDFVESTVPVSQDFYFTILHGQGEQRHMQSADSLVWSPDCSFPVEVFHTER